MDDSKERRKSVKSRRRSLRNLQPADVGTLAVDQAESLGDNTLDSQPMYGSIWIEQAVSPAVVRKPRRSISCSQISQDLANSVIRNKKNIYGKEHVEKENFSPESSPLKMVEDTPKKAPVLCPAKSSNSSPGNCSMEDVWNQENSYEEIGVPRFEHRTLDGSVSEESLMGTISILSIDETDLQCQDRKVNHSVDEELQILLGSFPKKEQNEIGMENISLSPDQITDPVNSFAEEGAQPSLDRFFHSVRSCSGSPEGLDCEIATPASPVEAQILNDSLPLFSGERFSNVPSEDSPTFSTELCQNFQQLDISEEDLTTGSDSETTDVNEESDVETLHENALDSLLTFDETFDTSLLNDSSLDQCCSQPSDSWCFTKCYPDEDSSDLSTLIDSSVSDGCEVLETDLSSAGSELSDSWCFSRHLDIDGHFNSTPCKTASPMAPLINNDHCVESVKHLIFTTEDEIPNENETIVPVGMEPSTILLEEEEQKLLAIEFLNLEDSSGSNEECQIQMPEKSQMEETELCFSSNDEPTKDEFVKTLPKKTLNKKSTQQISDSKTKKIKPSLNSAFQSTKKKQTDNSEKTPSSQPPTSTTMYNKSSQDLPKKPTSVKTKKQATVNTKITPHDKLKAPTDVKKNLGGKREPALGTQRPNAQTSKLEENSIKSVSKQKNLSKAVSPDVVILDALETTQKMNTMASRGEKVKTLSKSTKPLSTEKRKALKGSSKSLPVEIPLHESDLNQSLPQPGQQVGSEPIPVSIEETKTKADPVGTLPESSMKKTQRKGINASASSQVSNRPTSSAGTKRRSLDNLTTSTVTIRRLNTRTRPKSTDTSCDAEAVIDLVPAKDKPKNPVSSKWEKHRRRALVVPTLQTNDVTVVDLEPSALTSSSSDCTFSDDIFDTQVTTRTKRRCKSIGSSNSSIENSLVNDELAVLPTKVSSGRKKSCRSAVSVPESELQNMDTAEAQSESPLSEPVKILDDGVLAVHSQSQTTLRRSTRRRSIELSLSSNSNLKQTSVAAQGNNKTSQFPRSADRKVDYNEYDDEQLREIYAKKPYVPISPSRLETIYSPNKKRGECNVFSKRKLSRRITFQPSEARLKNRRKKAMRNWPFLFEVPDVDEKLYELLNST